MSESRRAIKIEGLLHVPLEGAPIRVERVPGLRDRYGPVHAGAFLRERRIALNCTTRELPRILTHELFHFVWLRAGNPRRLSYEQMLLAEFAAGARGELGWSAEWRKRALLPHDRRNRTRKWREYCCESFCDTAAWLCSGWPHPEFTLAKRFCNYRQRWFAELLKAGRLPV